jgi:hypothetical protein
MLPQSLREALETDATKTARILIGNPLQADNWHDKSGYGKLGEIDASPDSSIG